MLVQDVMTKDVITVSRYTSVVDAQRIMKEKKLTRLPVVDRCKLVGLVTDAGWHGLGQDHRPPVMADNLYCFAHHGWRCHA